MADIALIACTKSKADFTSSAALLYRSPLFKKSLLYALGEADRSYILSAKHGVLDFSDVIEPYEKSMNDLTPHEKMEWIEKVQSKLIEIIGPKDTVLVLAGQDYAKPTLQLLKKIGCRISLPLEGYSLGKRISWLTKTNQETKLQQQLQLFYSIMKELYVGQGGGRLFSECHGRMGWPDRGIYFICEPDQSLPTRSFKPLTCRFTRVGTHAVSRGSKATLWNRLSTHRGGNAGGGNHRSSIFRLHVGAAVISKDPSRWLVPTWGAGQVAPSETQKHEASLEAEVSRIIGRMRILWLNVPDEPSPYSDRSFLERNSIGLLSRSNILASQRPHNWLGTSSKNIDIAISGLWNLNYLYANPDDRFLDVLATYVEATLGKTQLPTKSIAPTSWYLRSDRSDSRQLSLFANDTSSASPK